MGFVYPDDIWKLIRYFKQHFEEAEAREYWVNLGEFTYKEPGWGELKRDIRNERYVNLPFWFSGSHSRVLPLVALQYCNVSLNMDFRDALHPVNTALIPRIMRSQEELKFYWVKNVINKIKTQQCKSKIKIKRKKNDRRGPKNKHLFKNVKR